MSIDWITVSAQIINFLILVWLLKRFLYQPVMRAMDQREQRIAEQLNDAQAREQKAEEMTQQFREKTKVLEQTSDAILAKAHAQAEQQKKMLLDEARQEVAEIREHWQRQAYQEKDEFLGELRYQISDSMQKITRKALQELADAHLETQIIDAFVSELAALDKASRDLMLRESENVTESIRVTSTFTLDEAMRDRVTKAIHMYLVSNIAVEFDESPELLCGIAVTIGAGQLGWNLADYLHQLNQQVEKAFVPEGTVVSTAPMATSRKTGE